LLSRLAAQNIHGFRGQRLVGVGQQQAHGSIPFRLRLRLMPKAAS
jgi:hypothetical protein